MGLGVAAAQVLGLRRQQDPVLVVREAPGGGLRASLPIVTAGLPLVQLIQMQSDDVIWQLIKNGFCSFKAKYVSLGLVKTAFRRQSLSG